MTISAGYAVPAFVCTSSAPPSSCVNPATPSRSTRWTPMPRQMALDEAGHLAVERGEDLVEHFDERHSNPAWTRFLRRLEAMNPPPITTARRAGFTNWIPE